MDTKNATTTTDRIQLFAKQENGEKRQLTTDEVLAQFKNPKAKSLYESAIAEDPNLQTDLAKWGARKAIQLENKFRQNGGQSKLVRPMLHSLCQHADDEGKIVISNLPIQPPKGNLKKWSENGFIMLHEEDDGKKITLEFTDKGIEAANETE